MVATEALRRLSVAGEIEAFFTFVSSEIPDVAMHCARTAELAAAIGSRMGIDRSERELLVAAALLHDIGKVWIPRKILHKPAPLSTTEFVVMMDHVILGSRYLERFEGHERLATIVGQHHERFDGRGYPLRIGGGTLDPLSRILTVADAYCASTEERPYQRAIAPDLVRQRIISDRAHHFDPDVVDAFAELDATTILESAAA